MNFDSNFINRHNFSSQRNVCVNKRFPIITSQCYHYHKANKVLFMISTNLIWPEGSVIYLVYSCVCMYIIRCYVASGCEMESLFGNVKLGGKHLCSIRCILIMVTIWYCNVQQRVGKCNRNRFFFYNFH